MRRFIEDKQFSGTCRENFHKLKSRLKIGFVGLVYYLFGPFFISKKCLRFSKSVPILETLLGEIKFSKSFHFSIFDDL